MQEGSSERYRRCYRPDRQDRKPAISADVTFCAPRWVHGEEVSLWARSVKPATNSFSCTKRTGSLHHYFTVWPLVSWEARRKSARRLASLVVTLCSTLAYGNWACWLNQGGISSAPSSSLRLALCLAQLQQLQCPRLSIVFVFQLSTGPALSMPYLGSRRCPANSTVT